MTSPINILAQLNFGSASAISENIDSKLRNHMYVETQLDTKLINEIQEDVYDLVLISGNAGDGKTAFLKHLERATNLHTRSRKKIVIDFDATESNSPYETQADKLTSLFTPFSDHADEQPLDAVYVIAINTGMIMHFFNNTKGFCKLKEVVMKAMHVSSTNDNETDESPWNVLLVDLNNRSIINAYGSSPDEPSIFDKILQKLFDESSFIWNDCKVCPVKDKCFVHFNARSMVASQVSERLKLLLNFVHFDSEFHITTRNLLNILSYLAISHHTYFTTDNFCDQIRKLVKQLEDFEVLLDNGPVQFLSAEKGILSKSQLKSLADFTQKMYYNLSMNDNELFAESELLNNTSYDMGGNLIDLLNGANQCNDFVNRSNQKVDELSSNLFFNLESILGGQYDIGFAPFEKFMFRIYGKVIERIYAELPLMAGQLTEETEDMILRDLKNVQLELLNVLKRREFFINEQLGIEDLSRYRFFHEYLKLIQKTTDLFDPKNEDNYDLMDEVMEQLDNQVGHFLKKLIHKHQGLQNWEEDSNTFFLIKDKNVERSLYLAFVESDFNMEPTKSFNPNQYNYMDCLLRYLPLQVNGQVAFTVNVAFYDFLRSISIGYEPLDTDIQNYSQVKILVEALKKVPTDTKGTQQELHFMDTSMQDNFHVHYKKSMGRDTLILEKNS